MKAKDTDREARIAATVETLKAATKSACITLSPDGRVGEHDAAFLIGYAPSSLKTMRATFGGGPSWYRVSVGAARVSYRLQDLAAWIEEKREEGL